MYNCEQAARGAAPTASAIRGTRISPLSPPFDNSQFLPKKSAMWSTKREKLRFLDFFEEMLRKNETRFRSYLAPKWACHTPSPDKDLEKKIQSSCTGRSKRLDTMSASLDPTIRWNQFFGFWPEKNPTIFAKNLLPRAVSKAKTFGKKRPKTAVLKEWPVPWAKTAVLKEWPATSCSLSRRLKMFKDIALKKHPKNVLKKHPFKNILLKKII